MIQRLFCIVLLLASAAVAQVSAEPPRVYIDTTWNPPTGGVTWSAHTSTDLRNALKGAQPGDVIALDAGVVYSGNFQITAKENPGNKWLYIVSTPFLPPVPPVRAADHNIFVPGTRVNPTTDAKYMAKIVTPNASPAILIKGASYVRFVGVELYSTSAYGADPAHKPWPVNGFTYYLLQLSGVAHVTVDRCYAHGSPTEDVNHAIGAGAGSTFVALVDSDVREIHGWTNDSQAFIAFASAGPFKVVNNFLSASSEDIMFGGAGGYANTVQPADIEIRNNHFWKDPAWEPMTSGARPWQWAIKNNLECKSCLRMVVTGNTMENVWYGSDQFGENIALTPRTNQSGYTAVDDDIDIENNTLKNANQGFMIGGYDSTCTAPACTIQGETKRIVIKNNLILTRDPAEVRSYHPLGFQIGQQIDGLLIQHNTVEGMNGTQSWGSVYFTLSGQDTHPASTNVYVLDNVFPRQVSGDSLYRGQKALDTYMPLPGSDGDRFVGNVMYVPADEKLNGTWPVHNYPTTVPLTFDGSAQLSTPMWSDTTDGAVAGIHPAQSQM